MDKKLELIQQKLSVYQLYNKKRELIPFFETDIGKDIFAEIKSLLSTQEPKKSNTWDEIEKQYIETDEYKDLSSDKTFADYLKQYYNPPTLLTQEPKIHGGYKDDLLLKYSKEVSLDLSEVRMLIPFAQWLDNLKLQE